MEGLANLGINIESLIIYLVNFGVLVFILNKYLFKQIAGFIEQRRANVQKSLEEAALIQSEFQSKLDELSAQKLSAEKKLNQELSNLRTFVDEKRAEMIAEIEEERAKMISSAQNEVETLKAEMFESHKSDLNKFIKMALAKIVSENVSEKAINQSFENSWTNYTKIK